MSPFSALLFIALATARNMLRRQIRRLREPRYVVGVLFGLFYFGNLFFRPFSTARATRVAPVDDLAHSLRGDAFAWAGMLFILSGWLFGGDESGLTFSEAEIQFLFPAPLTRRKLVHYKLVRSLVLALFSASFLTLAIGRTVGGNPPFLALGAWLGVGTLSLHLVAASLTRLRLLQEGLRGSARRALALVVPAAILGAIAGGFYRVPDRWPTHWPEVKPYLAHLADTAPLSWAALPLAPAARIAGARTAAELWPWLPISLGVIALHYLWALSTGAAFEQASIAAAERRALRIDGMRRGQVSIRTSARPPFALRAAGAPEVAIYWKNLTAAVRLLSVRLLLVLLLPALAGGTTILLAGGGLNRELGAAACGLMALSATLFGAQLYRIDFRLDLASIDLIKSFPLRGVPLAVAEVMAPFTVLTLGQWLFLGAAAIMTPPGVLSPFDRVPVLLAAMLTLPALTLPGLLVQNAAALFFPAWVESGTAAPRGIEAIGTRLLTLFGTLLAVSVVMVPAAAIGGIVGVVLYKLVGTAAVVGGAAAGALVVAGEAALAFVGLGRAYDRFDPGRA